MSEKREIRLVREADGEWTARDVDAEVVAQGETREAALSALDEAITQENEEGDPAEEGLETDRSADEPPDVFQ